MHKTAEQQAEKMTANALGREQVVDELLKKHLVMTGLLDDQMAELIAHLAASLGHAARCKAMIDAIYGEMNRRGLQRGAPPSTQQLWDDLLVSAHKHAQREVGVRMRVVSTVDGDGNG